MASPTEIEKSATSNSDDDDDDDSDIEAALKSLKNAIHVCDTYKRKSSFFDSIRRSKASYDLMTPEEVHAELCYAESLLQQAFLTFIQDENLVSFIKGALKIKTCLNSYRESVEVMKRRTWKEGDEKEHFQSGICVGVGSFNLMISLLPPKTLKLLEFVGYKASKAKGLRELETGASLEGGLRGPMCSILLIMYHTIFSFIFGIADGDVELSQKLLSRLLIKCPNSALLLCFNGRILEVSGKIDEAILKFEESINSQLIWKQFHHFCFWELMWCHCFNGNWLLAMKYAERLFEESNWSRATYAYQKAVFMIMCLEEDGDDCSSDGEINSLGKNENRKQEMMVHIKSLFEEVPKLKQRIAGKSIPVEKFAIKKVDMYFEQNEYLTLPAYELLYIWNGFEILSKRMDLLEPVYARIKKHRFQFESNNGADSNPCFHDNLGLLNMLEGVCLRHMGKKHEAFAYFRAVLDSEKNIKKNTYLLPVVLYEAGMISFKEQKFEEAKKCFENARSNYSGYNVESRIASKIQAALMKIKFLTEKADDADLVDCLDSSKSVSQKNHPAAI